MADLPAAGKSKFDLIQKCYEERDYQRSVTLLDELLAEYPACVEGLAMKGLVCRNLPSRHHEALPALKLAIRHNVKSGVAWHALGGYHRMEGNYELALKSYTQAALLSQKPAYILKDVARAQLYLRKPFQFLKTCQEVFINNRNNKLDWMIVPVAADLCDRPKEAAQMLGSWFRLPQEVQDSATPLWTAEVKIYLAELHERAGELELAERLLDAALELELDFKDRPQANVVLGRVALRLGHYEMARKAYTQLIKYLPANIDYMLGYTLAHQEYHKLLPLPAYNQASDKGDTATEKGASQPWSEAIPVRLYPDILTTCGVRSSLYVTEPMAQYPGFEVKELSDRGIWRIAYNRGDLWRQFWVGNVGHGLAEESVENKFSAEFLELALAHGNSDALRLFPIAFLSAENPFVKEQVNYVFGRWIAKGSVALIAEYQILCNTKVAARRALVQASLEEVWEEFRVKCEADKQPSGVGKAIYLCSKAMVIARLDRDWEQGFALLEEALEILPTLIDLHEAKAQLLHDRGQDEASAQLFCVCADMDKADKHVCSAAVAALCRINDIPTAVRYHSAFNATAAGKSTTSFDTQDQEFEIALSRALCGIGLYDEAAKRLIWLLKRLQQHQEDVQDFHYYSLRMGNMGAFPDYARYLTRIFGLKAAQGALNLLCWICFSELDGELRPTNALAPAAKMKDHVDDDHVDDDHVDDDHVDDDGYKRGQDGAKQVDIEAPVETTADNEIPQVGRLFHAFTYGRGGPKEVAGCVENARHVLGLIKDVPCLIAKPINIYDIGRTALAKDVLEPLLACFRHDVQYQSFGVLKHTYNLYSRDEFRNDWLVACAVKQTMTLALDDAYHPKAFPVMAHYYCSNRESPHDLVREVLSSYTLGQLGVDQRGADERYVEDWLTVGINKLSSSWDIKDRYGLVQGLVACLLSEKRGQGKCAVKTELLDQVLNKILNDKTQIQKHSGLLAYGETIRKIALVVEPCKGPTYQLLHDFFSE
ncbi:NMDA receptor-regulated protein 1 [Gregarina niphandrodes]|uniref:NMDA receptor-regulated protein 1 n=1 Tax=Gregarina niphandrodes TaxID=110365 RepID=A0A023B054_GRENI|nr:NMDA receptor-regulated protein 1 [Gregarina niphandrodes]EZG44895.1 NMDA receptor-regulated protein 1 [Gregarina niphandrodes]|eukprot:XP_011132626.1 NMDA receptor-regulated protein 1 [Gregarina niphandrodes]